MAACLLSPCSFKSPEEGFEPTTNGLTVRCSTAELFRNKQERYVKEFADFIQHFFYGLAFFSKSNLQAPAEQAPSSKF